MRTRFVLARHRIVAALMLSFSVQLVAMAQELVTLDRGSAYELTWHDRDKLTAHVYVSRNATAKGPITIALRSVADGKRTDPKLTGDFQVTPAELPEAATGFEISSPPSTSLKAGTYEATLTFAAGTTKQNVNLQLIVPSATLVTPATLQLSRVVWPFRGPVAEGGTDLVLLETSGKSHASVKLLQSEPFSNTDGQYGSGLAVAPAAVAKGELVRLPVSIDADLPFGTTSTKLTVASDQLAAPLTVPVQVRTRRTKAVLAVVILFGLLFGYLLRMRLKPSIELGTARERVFAAINAMIDSSDDVRYRREMSEARAALARAVMSADATPETLKTAITTAQTAQQTATTNLNTHLQTVSGLRDSLAATVTPPWMLPDSIAAAVTGAAARLKDATRRLDERNASAAEDVLIGAIGSLRQELRSQVAPWRNNAQSVLRQLGAVQLLIDATSRPAFAAAIKAVEDQVAKSTIAPAADLAAIRSAIEAIHSATEPFPDLIKQAANEVTGSFDFMDAVLADKATADPDSWARAGEKTREFVTTLGGIVIESPDTWRGIEANAQALRNRWRSALLAQTTEAAVVTAFDASDFRTVARELETALRVSPVPRDAIMRDDAGAEFGLAAPVVAVNVSVLAEPQRPPDAAPAPSSLLPFIERTRQQLMRETVVQWVLSATALTFVGYLIFADKFVGTNADLMAAFFWGFTTDIGVDALVSAAKSKP